MYYEVISGCPLTCLHVYLMEFDEIWYWESILKVNEQIVIGRLWGMLGDEKCIQNFS